MFYLKKMDLPVVLSEHSSSLFSVPKARSDWSVQIQWAGSGGGGNSRSASFCNKYHFSSGHYQSFSSSLCYRQYPRSSRASACVHVFVMDGEFKRFCSPFITL